MHSRKLERAQADTFTVADIMVSPVRTVAPDLSLAGLVRIFLSEQITGAPVVDADGSIVGVVSSSDVIRAMTADDEVAAGDTLRDPDGDASARSRDDPQETLLGYFNAPEPAEVPVAALPERAGSLLHELTVVDVMTPASFAIAPEATVRELAAFLTRGRIHRSLVVERGALRGIVTSSDIVRLIAGDEGEGVIP